MPTLGFASGRQPSERTTGSAVALIFLVALAVRWAYAASLYGFMGEPGLMGGDSYGYLKVARELVENLQLGRLPVGIGSDPTHRRCHFFPGSRR